MAEPLCLKIETDWGAFPVWVERGSIDLTMAISEPLRARFQSWADEESNVTAGVGSGRSRTLRREWCVDWRLRGIRLAQQLATEVGPDAEIIFFGERLSAL